MTTAATARRALTAAFPANLALRIAVPLLFYAACLTARIGFPTDVFSLHFPWPLWAVRVVNAFIALGVGIGARWVGRLLLDQSELFPSGPLELSLSLTLGIAALAIGAHLPSAFHALRFPLIAPSLTLLVALGTPIWLEDMEHLRRWVKHSMASEMLVLTLAAFFAFPVLVKASVSFFTSDELTMYLPILREFVRQGSFDPVIRIEMLNTFTTGGFSLLTLGYLLGGDGTAIYLSFSFLLILCLGIYGVARDVVSRPLAAFAPLLFFFFCQILIAGRIDDGSFLSGGMGLAKLHSLTALLVFESTVLLTMYLRQPSRGAGQALALIMSFLAGVQFLGFAFFVLFMVAMLGWAAVSRESRKLHFGVAALAFLAAAPWYLKP